MNSHFDLFRIKNRKNGPGNADWLNSADDSVRASLDMVVALGSIVDHILTAPLQRDFSLNHRLKPSKDIRGHREKEKSNEVERNRKFYYEGRGL